VRFHPIPAGSCRRQSRRSSNGIRQAAGIRRPIEFAPIRAAAEVETMLRSVYRRARSSLAGGSRSALSLGRFVLGMAHFASRLATP
jgi:hypothetical protein